MSLSSATNYSRPYTFAINSYIIMILNEQITPSTFSCEVVYVLKICLSSIVPSLDSPMGRTCSRGTCSYWKTGCGRIFIITNCNLYNQPHSFHMSYNRSQHRIQRIHHVQYWLLPKLPPPLVLYIARFSFEVLVAINSSFDIRMKHPA